MGRGGKMGRWRGRTRHKSSLVEEQEEETIGKVPRPAAKNLHRTAVQFYKQVAALY
jgi:hypothetical protein